MRDVLFRSACAAIALSISGAGVNAQFTATGTAPGAVSGEPIDTGTRDASGDIFGANITVFGPAGGAFFDGAPNTQTFGVSQTMGVNFQGRGVQITSSELTISGGTQRRYTIVMSMADGGAFLPVGATLGGGIIDTIGFEIGGGNTVADPINDPDVISWADPFSGGAFNGVFNLYNSVGGLLFSGNVFYSGVAGSTGYTRVFLNAGGADLSTFDIAKGEMILTANIIPSPGAAGVLALAGIVAVRRRR